jgi:phosphodiesterase/alkaline phosphatase D-like protein
VTFSSFTAKWSNVRGATGYRLDVATDSSFINYVSGYQNLDVGNVTSFPVSGLNAQTTYYYRMRAFNGCAPSASSNVKSVQTLPCVPATPNAQNANNVTFSSFTAHWSNVNGAIDYRLDVATDLSFINYVSGYQNLDVGNVTSLPVPGLTAQTTYYYRVRAYNGCAPSANSNVKNAQTLPCVPAAPNGQNATNVTFSSFTAHWSNVGGTIDYRLDVATDSSFINYVPGYQDLSVGIVTSFPVTGLSPQTTYYYRVRAYNGCAPSVNSNVKNVQTLPCNTPAAPNAQNATNITASSFTAHWSNVGGVIDYRLDVSTSNTFTTYVPGYQNLSVGIVTSYPVGGLTANTTYYYRVRAYNGCAPSANSNIRSVQTTR